MDDATSLQLVSELQKKLADFEQRVIEHRRDMATEFRRYSHDVLRGASPEVVVEVEKAIKESMPNYPALSPALDHASPITNVSPSSDGSDRKENRTLLPPLLPHTSSTPPDSSSVDSVPRSPHAREKEFQGLFTPSYLPLLGEVAKQSKDEISPPTSPPALVLPLAEQSAKPEKGVPSAFLKVEEGLRPDPIRRYTEETNSSTTSDDSTKGRRSALRRSSSASVKTHSPRRVRFEVEGGEVLPTASPPKSPKAADHLPSPLGNSTSLLDESYDSSINDAEDNQDPDVGSLLGNSPPGPKKVSSTDRLKALARNSTEDTSKWTVVGNLQDPDDEEDMLVMARPNVISSGSVQPAVADAYEARPQTQIFGPSDLGQPQEDLKLQDDSIDVDDGNDEDEEEEDDDDDDDDDGDDDMPVLMSSKSKNSLSPSRSTVASDAGSKSWHSANSTAKPGPKTLNVGDKGEAVPEILRKPALEATDGEDMFEWEFDEEESPKNEPLEQKTASKPPKKYIEYEDDTVEHSTTDSESKPDKMVGSLYSTSPAVPIRRTGSLTNKKSPAEPQVQSTAVGSYRGKPFSIGSIKNPEVAKKAAEMGDVYSFVGSVDGRSGVDESTSYRPDFSNFTGTPKSLSERMILEDIQESRRSSPDPATRMGASR